MKFRSPDNYFLAILFARYLPTYCGLSSTEYPVNSALSMPTLGVFCTGTAKKKFRGQDAVENTPSPAIRNGKPSPATVNTSRDKRRRFMQPPTQKRCQALHPSKPGIATFPRSDQKKQQNASRTSCLCSPKWKRQVIQRPCCVLP